jgi:hypothetical protein
MDFEELVELRDGKDLAHGWPGVRQGKPTAALPQATVQRNELAEGGAGKVFHHLEVEDEVLPRVLLDEPGKLLVDDLDVVFVQVPVADEANDSALATPRYSEERPFNWMRQVRISVEEDEPFGATPVAVD